jgi:hypothetical protein
MDNAKKMILELIPDDLQEYFLCPKIYVPTLIIVLPSSMAIL